MKVLLLGFWLAFFGFVALAGENTIRLTAEQISHLGVRMARPQAVDTIPLAQAPGRVVLPPAKEFAVGAFQAGVITRVNVPLGVKVRQGQVLAEINSVALLDIQRALVESSSAFSVAEARLRRDETLLREGVISRMRWQETRSDFDRAMAALQAAEQTLLASGASASEIRHLKTAHQLSGIYRVVSPIDGVVLERMAVVGQRVDVLAPLFRIGRLDELWIEVSVPQERIKEIRIGDPITVENPRTTARVIEVGQSVDPQSQTLLVRALVEEGAMQLRPGMQVNVQIMHNSLDRGFRVPAAAVFNHEGHHYLFVRHPDGFEAREVAVAGQEPHSMVLHEGLKEGEAIVVQGISGLKAVWLGMGEDQPSGE